MECNKDEAIRARGIAEQKFLQYDVVGAKKFALKAQRLFPGLEGLPQLLAVLDVHIVAQDKVNGMDANWYGILQTDPMADDATIRKQYRKLALILHPDKNKAVGAEGAFKLISEAWGVLSDKGKKTAYDARRGKFAGSANGFCNFTHFRTSIWPRPKPAAQKAPTFWTACSSCKNHFRYLRVHENENVFCRLCHQPFSATEIQGTSGDASRHPLDRPYLRTECNAEPLFSEQPTNHHHTCSSASVHCGSDAWHHKEQSNTRTDDKANLRTEGDASQYTQDWQTRGGSTSWYCHRQPNPSASSETARAPVACSYSDFQFYWGGRRNKTAENHSDAAVRETAEMVHNAYETVKTERVKAQKEARHKYVKERMEAEMEARRKEHRECREQKQKSREEELVKQAKAEVKERMEAEKEARRKEIRERREQKQRNREEELERQAKATAHAKKAFDKLFASECKPSLEDFDSRSMASFQCRRTDS